MWAIAVASILLRIFSAVGHAGTALVQDKNRAVSTEDLKTDVRYLKEEKNVEEFGPFMDEMVDWASSTAEFVKEKFSGAKEVRASDEDRKLKHKKVELKFMMKTLLILKIVLGLVLPIGIIASKILSWKAVTLSLMAFMLAKILFLKHLLAGKNSFSMTPTNVVPPVFIHGGPNELFWKRQGDAQSAFPWNST